MINKNHGDASFTIALTINPIDTDKPKHRVNGLDMILRNVFIFLRIYDCMLGRILYQISLDK